MVPHGRLRVPEVKLPDVFPGFAAPQRGDGFTAHPESLCDTVHAGARVELRSNCTHLKLVELSLGVIHPGVSRRRYMPAFRSHVQIIVRERTREEVGRVYAPWVIAPVADSQSDRVRSGGDPIAHTVSADVSALGGVFQNPVTVDPLGGLPFPAQLRVHNRHLSPEAFQKLGTHERILS